VRASYLSCVNRSRRAPNQSKRVLSVGLVICVWAAQVGEWVGASLSLLLAFYKNLRAFTLLEIARFLSRATHITRKNFANQMEVQIHRLRFQLL
jgi:hypothetical protein